MTKHDVDLVFRERRLFSTAHFLVRWRRTDNPFPRASFAFSRASGNAVTRNRFKRRLRAVVALAAEHAGIDFVFVPKTALTKITVALWQNENKKISEFCEHHFKS